MARSKRPKAEVGVTDDDMDVRSLEGLGPTSAQRLEEEGVITLRELVNRGPVEIARATNADRAFVAMWIREAEDKLRRLGSMDGLFMSGKEMAELAKKTEYISTGSRIMDELLRGDLDVPHGGVETDAITEFFGKFGSGKTQTLLKLVPMAMLPREKGGIDSDVVFVDGENIYQKTVERIHHMASTVGMDPDELDSRITVVRPRSSDQQLEALKGVEKIIRESRGRCRVLIVDGGMTLVRHDYGILGRDGLPPRSRWLNLWWGRIRRMVDAYHLAVVVSNQVSSKTDGIGDPIHAFGGDITAHTSTYRIYFRKNSDLKPKSTAIVEDSPRHGRYFAQFWLSRAGPCDAEPKAKFDPKLDGDPKPG